MCNLPSVIQQTALWPEKKPWSSCTNWVYIFYVGNPIPNTNGLIYLDDGGSWLAYSCLLIAFASLNTDSLAARSFNSIPAYGLRDGIGETNGCLRELPQEIAITVCTNPNRPNIKLCMGRWAKHPEMKKHVPTGSPGRPTRSNQTSCGERTGIPELKFQLLHHLLFQLLLGRSIRCHGFPWGHGHSKVVPGRTYWIR